MAARIQPVVRFRFFRSSIFTPSISVMNHRSFSADLNRFYRKTPLEGFIIGIVQMKKKKIGEPECCRNRLRPG
jgi:hypothetical protein